MCAVFIGELRRLRTAGRILLLALAGVVALVVNFGRTFWLALAAAKGGVGGAGDWHDKAGVTALILCFGLLWLLSMIFRRKGSEFNFGAGNFRAIHPAILGGAVCWLLLAELATGAWYSSGGKDGFARTDLRLAELPDAKKYSLSEQVRSILRFDEGDAYQRSRQDGTHWWIYRLRWNASGAGANLARYHSPEMCLPAAGFRQTEPGRMIEAHGIPFRFLKYEWQGKPVYVFSSYRSANGTDTVRRFEDFDLTWSKRVRAAIRGVRAGEQEVLQVVISGAISESRAEAAFLEFAGEALFAGKA